MYLLGTLAVFGTVPHDKLLTSGAPFTDAVNAMFGGTWGGAAVACAALVSIVGALNGWTLLSAQTAYAAARDGLFPARFAVKRRGMSTFGVTVTVVLGSLLTVYNYTAGTARVFEILVLVTTFTATVPYLLATAAQLYRRGSSGAVLHSRVREAGRARCPPRRREVSRSAHRRGRRALAQGAVGEEVRRQAVQPP